MARLFLGGLLLVATLVYARAQDCTPYGRPRARGCATYERERNDPSFYNLNTLLRDASEREDLNSFVLNITLGMYNFINPCSSNAEAILRLFYDHDGDVPDSQSQWWQDMSGVVGEQTLVGRRKRQGGGFDSETELLFSQLRGIVRDDENADCVQYLIDQYTDAAEAEFKRQHPDFSPPTPGPDNTATTATTTATTEPPTTQPSPATTTTASAESSTPAAAADTTPPPTTPPSTPPAVEGTTTPSTTPTPVTPARCTVCTGIDCLLSAHVQDCGALEGFCITKVEDTSGGRQISRECADQQTCDTIANDPECADIETSVLTDGVQCDYCCTGQENCNRPPQLLPNNVYTPQP